MATAAFKLNKCTGANAATEANCDKHPCFLSADMVSTETGTYPVAVPSDGISGPNYSYEQWLRLECTLAPNNQVDNIKFYGPNEQPDAPSNKVTIYAGTTVTGLTPTDSQSSVATTAQHSNYIGTGPGEFLAIGVVPEDDIIDAIGEKTDYLVLQMKVEYLALHGNLTTMPFAIEYDES